MYAIDVKKESEVPSKAVFVPDNTVINGKITTIDGVQIVKVDLCDDCCTQLKYWIKGHK